MNAMVLISEEFRNDLLGRRVSGEVRVLGDGTGGIRVPPVSSESRDDVERKRAVFGCKSSDLEGSETSGEWRTWMHGFEIGDMVWGKVKSHPWWPGHVFNEAFASSFVRKTKHEGHVLVAFFGDSSYGWFEPTELLPFDSHFAEKSKQTTSRNFQKAVEEALDEVSRRRALGLSCCCRDPFSFRPVAVPGYAAVDVIGHEPNLVYSWKEIKDARDAFVPGEVISSLGQLALAPCEAEHGTIGIAKTIATLSALRKAMFEEFDETYAQAFGVEPVRPSPDARVKDQLPVSSRAAPLSGPLVVAEALGSRRGGGGGLLLSRSRASKDQSKKNKYLFKRRDDAPPPPPVGYVVISPSSHSSPPAPEPEDGFVLQKRPPPSDPTAAAKIEVERPPDEPAAALEEDGDARKVEKGGDVEEEKKPEKIPSPGSDAGPSPNPDPGPAPVAGDADAHHRKRHDATVSGVVVRKVSKLPRSEGEAIESKKKRKKIDGDVLLPFDRAAKQPRLGDEPEKRPVGRPQGSNAMGGFTPIALPKIELTPQDLQFPLLVEDLAMLALDPYHGMERNASLIVRHVFLRFRSLVYQKSLVSPTAGEPEVEIGGAKLEVGAVVTSPELTTASPALAQELQEPAEVVKQEPSVVSRKAPSSLWKLEPGATPWKQEPAAAAVSKMRHPPTVVLKSASRRPDDPTRANRKRPPSDRQEEMTIRREKKLKQLKALALEKKTGILPQKAAPAVDAHRATVRKDGDVKPAIVKISKIEKKPETRVPSPTYMFMKFPPGTALPTVAHQKVKFGRFGPLDVSAFRVYWKTCTCKMVFKYKEDAESALLYAMSNDMFGQIKVQYSIKEVEAPVSEPVEAEKLPAEADASNVQSKLGRNDEPANDPRSSALRIQQQQQSVQLKSCLKKPLGDEGGASGAGTGGVAKETPRVKFMLAGEDGGRDPSIAPGNGGNGDGILPPPPMESQIKIPRPINPLPPLLQHPPPRPIPMLPPRPQSTFPPPPPPVATLHEHGAPQILRAPAHLVQPPTDISSQMLNLLLQCRDVVSSMNSAVGYVVYHPL